MLMEILEAGMSRQYLLLNFHLISNDLAPSLGLKSRNSTTTNDLLGMLLKDPTVFGRLQEHSPMSMLLFSSSKMLLRMAAWLGTQKTALSCSPTLIHSVETLTGLITKELGEIPGKPAAGGTFSTTSAKL